MSKAAAHNLVLEHMSRLGTAQHFTAVDLHPGSVESPQELAKNRTEAMNLVNAALFWFLLHELDYAHIRVSTGIIALLSRGGPHRRRGRVTRSGM